MLQTIESINSVINNFIWGIPAIIIGWGLYGARCMEFLFTDKLVKPFMVIPNLIGVFLLSGTVFQLVKEGFLWVKSKTSL